MISMIIHVFSTGLQHHHTLYRYHHLHHLYLSCYAPSSFRVQTRLDALKRIRGLGNPQTRLNALKATSNSVFDEVTLSCVMVNLIAQMRLDSLVSSKCVLVRD